MNIEEYKSEIISLLNLELPSLVRDFLEIQLETADNREITLKHEQNLFVIHDVYTNSPKNLSILTNININWCKQYCKYASNFIKKEHTAKEKLSEFENKFITPYLKVENVNALNALYWILRTKKYGINCEWIELALNKTNQKLFHKRDELNWTKKGLKIKNATDALNVKEDELKNIRILGKDINKFIKSEGVIPSYLQDLFEHKDSMIMLYHSIPDDLIHYQIFLKFIRKQLK